MDKNKQLATFTQHRKNKTAISLLGELLIIKLMYSDMLTVYFYYIFTQK